MPNRRQRRAQALGHGSVAITGDNYAPITTNTFVGKWYRLADAVQRWNAYVDGKLGDDFHDRESLAAEVSALVSGETVDRGFLLLEADAGLGKTTFAAWLSRQGGHPTHFTQLNPDARHQSTAIRSLTAQLIAAWDLHDLAPDGLLPAASDTPDWFVRVITAAAARRDRLADERGFDADESPIVLVVDALDAAASHPDGQPPLGLPSDLPRGVYIVATSRSGAVRHLPAGARVRRLSGRDEANLAELHGYLDAQARQPWLADLLAEAGIPAERFVDTLVERGRGVWVYVHYVLESLRRDPGEVRRLPRLPRGLDAYYHDDLLPLCEGERARIILPLLGTLAVAAEPLEARALAELSGLTAADDAAVVDQVLNGVLRPFCSVRSVGLADRPTRLFEALHPSLGEYLSGGPDPALNGTDSHERLRELTARSCREAHHRISDRYLSLWGGLSTGVPALAADPSLLTTDRGYALRWLLTHLEVAGRQDDIHRLLAAEHDGGNVWYQGHDVSGDLAAYLHDVERAMRLAPDHVERLRYRLIEAGIASISVAVPPRVLAELVDRGLWTVERAFSLFEQASRKRVDAENLTRMIPRLPAELLDRALSLVVRIFDHRERAAALNTLIPRLSTDQLAMVVPVVEGLMSDASAKPLATLMARWPQDRTCELRSLITKKSFILMRPLTEVMLRLRDIGDDQVDGLPSLGLDRFHSFEYPEIIGALIAYLPSKLCRDALALVEPREAKFRGDAVAGLMTHVPVELLGDVFDLVVRMRESGKSPSDRDQARLTAILLSRSHGAVPDSHLEFIATVFHPRNLVPAVPQLDERQVHELISRLDTLTRDYNERFENTFFRAGPREGRDERAKDHVAHARLVDALARRLPALEGACLVGATFGDRSLSKGRVGTVTEFEVAASLCGWDAEEVRGDLLERICRFMGIASADWPRACLEQLAPYLSDQQVDEAFALVTHTSVQNLDARLAAADVLAPHLSDDRLRAVMGQCVGSALEEQCFSAIAGLASRLPRTAGEAAVLDALIMAENIGQERLKARAVTRLAPAIPPSLSTEAAEFISATANTQWMAETFESLEPLMTPAQLLRSYETVADVINPLDTLRVAVKAMPGVFARLGREHPAVLDTMIRRLFTSDVDPTVRHDPTVDARIARWRGDLMVLAPFLPSTQARLAWNLMERTRHWELFGNDDCRTVELRACLAARFDDDERGTAVDDLLTNWPWEEQLDDRFSHVPEMARTLAALGTAAMTPKVEDAYRRLLQHPPGRSYRCEILSILEGTIPRTLSRPAVEYALSEKAIEHGFEALTHLGDCLTAADRDRAIRHVTDPARLVFNSGDTGIATMLPYVADHRRPELIAFAAEHFKPWSHLTTITNLLRYSSGDQRSTCLDIAVEHCLRNLHHWQDDWWKDGTVMELLRQFTAEELRALYTRTPEIRADTHMASLQAAILAELGNRPRHDRSPPGWDPTSVWPTALDRGELFTHMAAGAWWIDDTFGRSGTARMLTAVFDVARWWP